MERKRTYRKYFIVIYIVSYLMMLPPLIYLGDGSAFILGLPVLIIWLVFWGSVMVIALTIQYLLDKKYESREKQRPDGN